MLRGQFDDGKDRRIVGKKLPLRTCFEITSEAPASCACECQWASAHWVGLADALDVFVGVALLATKRLMTSNRRLGTTRAHCRHWSVWLRRTCCQTRDSSTIAGNKECESREILRVDGDRLPQSLCCGRHREKQLAADCHLSRRFAAIMEGTSNGGLEMSRSA